jgi:ABC-type polysaccharide/polyol phosphate transport system ATPase subunit
MMQRIIVDKLSKEFKIGFKRNQTALSRIISLFSARTPTRKLKALQNISFAANEGEIVGIIGKNGSGKSTLLRIIAGIYSKDKGIIKTNGKIISLIQLAIGLEQRLTVKENIYLCCSLFGLGQKDIRNRFDSIIKFAELDDFTDTKVYQFSQGMLQRLAFSIAIYCRPEILLLDEVFEVGDQPFREKSSNKIKELVKNGTSVILVSHRLEMIQKHCNRTIWLDKGIIVKDGRTDEVVKDYLRE